MKHIKTIFNVAKHLGKRIWEKHKHAIVKKGFDYLKKASNPSMRKIFSNVE